MKFPFTLRVLGIIFVLIGGLGCTFALTTFVSESEQAQAFIGNFGYLGVVVLAVIAGLNALIPIPAASFVPVFEAAGMLLPLIVVSLVVGTTIADAIGYAFGHWSRATIAEKYPKTVSYIEHVSSNHKHWVLPSVFVYAAIVPFPNEAVVIPIALAGLPFRLILIPLALGNLINQGALAYGISNIFLLFV